MEEKKLEFYDVVESKRNSEYGIGKPLNILSFPQIKCCSKCNGAIGVIHNGELIEDEDLLAKVMYVKYGYDGLQLPAPYFCTCNGREKVDVEQYIDRKSHFPFPMLCRCCACHGYTSTYSHDHKENNDPNMAYYLALVEFGYSVCKRCDNYPPNHACDCDERFAYLKQVVSTIKIKKDSLWVFNEQTSRPHRGLRDYSRKIEFEKDLTKDEMELFKEYLQKDNCPGWTPIWFKKDGKVYTFSTTWDSSD